MKRKDHPLPPLPLLDVATPTNATIFKAAALVHGARIECIVTHHTYKEAVSWGVSMQRMYPEAVIEIKPITVN